MISAIYTLLFLSTYIIAGLLFGALIVGLIVALYAGAFWLQDHGLWPGASADRNSKH